MTTFIQLASVLVAMMIQPAASHPYRGTTINAVIGNESFEKTFGRKPQPNDDPHLRIQTHLRYVEQVLREKPLDDLTPTQRERRVHLLDLLHTYAEAGVFPQNTRHEGFRPCFIDDQGAICAVGYLVAQTAGRAAAEAINAQFQYGYLMDMNSPLLDEWIAQSGLTRRECAMIQPSYWLQGDVHTQLPMSYVYATSGLTGLNCAMMAMNLNGYDKPVSRAWGAGLGIGGGAASLTLGIINYKDVYVINGWYGLSPRMQNLSMLNMGMGVASMTMGFYRLLKPIDQRANARTWHIQPGPVGAFAGGCTLSRRF